MKYFVIVKSGQMLKVANENTSVYTNNVKCAYKFESLLKAASYAEINNIKDFTIETVDYI